MNRLGLKTACSIGFVVLFATAASAADKVRFSSVPFIGSMPTNVALAEGYFSEENIDITVTDHPGGWLALKDLFEGRADIAAVAELPVVYSMFDKRKFTEADRPDFVIFGDLIYSQDIQKLVARKDSGIETPADLKGKTVGLMRGTTIDFYMDAFFAEYSLDKSETTFVDLNSYELEVAIENGDVDAIFTWEPHVSNTVATLGDNAVKLSSNAGFTTAWLLVATRDYAEANPEILARFLKAVYRAELFIGANPERAIAIQSERSKTPMEAVSRIIEVVEFDLSLSEALLTTMEGEANWLLRTGAYEAPVIPDFLELFYFDAMERVKPVGIGVLR